MGRLVVCGAQVALVTVPALGTGCAQPCPLGVYPAVETQVRDSVTNLPAAAGARGAMLRSGTVVDSLRLVDDAKMIGWGTGPATYRVTVAKTGYRDWVREGVLVTRSGGACPAINTVALQVRLVPLP